MTAEEELGCWKHVRNVMSLDYNEQLNLLNSVFIVCNKKGIGALIFGKFFGIIPSELSLIKFLSVCGKISSLYFVC